VKQKPFQQALYEAVLYAYGRAFAKYDPFAYEVLIKEVGKELLAYLRQAGYPFVETGAFSDVEGVLKFFVEQGFVEQLEVKPAEVGNHYLWHGLLGQDAYELLQETTSNPFLSCPLNAAMLYLAQQHGKTLKLYGKTFDREQRLVESHEGLVDLEPAPGYDFKKLPLEQEPLLRLAEEKTQRLEAAIAQLQVEVALRKKLTNHLAEAQALAHLGSWQWNLQTDEVAWSDEAFRLLGLEPGSIAPSLELIQQRVSPTDRDEFRRRIGRSLEFHEPFDMEMKILTPQGRTHYLNAKARIELDSHGHPLRFDGVALDITSRKKLESLLQFQSEITHNMGEGVQLIRCSDLQVVYTNPSFDRLFGVPAGAYLGKPAATLFADPANQPFLPRSKPFIQLQHKGHWQGEVECLKANGEPFWNLITISLFSHEEFGEVWIAVQTDITDRIARRTELIQAKTAAEEANAAKSQLLASISHEVRTPLNSILGFTELLLAEADEPRQHELLLVVQRSGQTLLELINQLLDLSKVEAGKMELHPTNLDLPQLLVELEREFAPRAHSAKLSFGIEMPPVPPVQLDGLRLRQILSNLLVNAFKFTETGHVKLSLQTQTQEPGSLNLEFKVTDTGIGIPADQLERVFEPFIQDVTNPLAMLGGSGLGLSISKRLAELMGGQLTVQSQLDQGSVFTLILPQVKEAPPDRVAEAPRPLKGKHVLVADDIAANRLLLGATLERAGADVTYAEDGLETLRLAKSKHPDLILMDLKMPRLDGINAARALKQDPSTSHIPILAVTADLYAPFDPQDFVGIITKPVNLAQLVTQVVKWVFPATS